MSLKSYLLLSGSGPGAPRYYLHVWDPDQKRLRSFRWEKLKTLYYPAASADGKTVIGTGRWEQRVFESNAVGSDPPLEFVGKYRLLSGYTVWMKDLRGGMPLNHLAKPREGALYYPRFSPTGMSFAWLETPGIDYPPQKEAVAQIRILDGESGNFGLSPFSVQALLAPFDWGPGGTSLIFTNEAGALCQAWMDPARRVETLALRGWLPRFSPDGQRLAYYADGAIVIRKGTEQRFSTRYPVVQLCWVLHEPALWYAEVVGPWRAQVSILDLDSGCSTAVFETGLLSTMDTIAHLPEWEEFGGHSRTAPGAAAARVSAP